MNVSWPWVVWRETEIGSDTFTSFGNYEYTLIGTFYFDY
ncbi:unnamed protein product [Amoebophrya sp. A25]|nr:unnamed protein product [Amoebophrya sp. A25]|eukprot:GSA25T00011403001.1